MMKLLIILCLSAMLVANGADDQPNKSRTISPAPPKQDCESIMSKMTSCLGYLVANGDEISPPVMCCHEFNVLLQFDPQCCCYGLRKSIRMGLDLNYTRVFSLDLACHINVTPFDCRVTLPGRLPKASVSPPKPATVVRPSAPPAEEDETDQDWSPAPAPSPESSGSSSLYGSVLVSLVVAAFCSVFA